jgi:probable rRNA maturation factor
MNTIDVVFKNVLETNIKNPIKSFGLSVLEFLNINEWEISVLICDDITIKDLNSQFRSKDEPTDVLSFNQDLVSIGNIVYAGDIVISLERVKYHAKTYNVDCNEELKRVLIHGILHLNGMDHETNSVDEEMLQVQEAILTSISGEKII